MAFLVVEINYSDQTIQDINDKCISPGDKGDCANGIINMILSVSSGNHTGSIQITSRGTTAGVTTDGDPQSEQKTFAK